MDSEEQKDELEAVFSMYSDTDCLTLYDKQSTNSGPSLKRTTSQGRYSFHPTGVFVISPEMDTKLALDDKHLSINFFPPFYFTFFLPARYPSRDKPLFSLTSEWLSKQLLQPIIDQIDEIIAEACGSPVLIRIFCYLHQEALNDVFEKWSLISSSSGGNSVLDIHKLQAVNNKENLLHLLTSHNSERLLFRFTHDYHECIVCASTSKGDDCIRFEGCDHICCVNCVRTSYSIKVTEGNVLEFKCLACDSHATPAQLARLLSAAQLERIEKLSVSRALDTMEDVLQCPRCEFPVIVEVESKLGHCQKCSMAFCTLCRKSYHAKNPCSWDLKKEQLLAYQSSSGENRKQLEDKYGRERLQQAWNEHLSQEFVEKNNVSCPCCRSSIEKSGGCNKMVCLKCGTYFCWLCRMRLIKDNPYQHFSNMLSPCYNRLFEGIIDPEWEVMEENESDNEID